MSSAVGLDFIEDSRSFALADIDHDGRLEVVLKNRNSPQLRVLKNVAQGSSAIHCLSSAGHQKQSRRRRCFGHHRKRIANSNPNVCAWAPASFRNTARRYFSGLENIRAPCVRRFAGLADWCSNSRTFQSIIGFGCRRESSPREWSRSKARSLCRATERKGQGGGRSCAVHSRDVASGAGPGPGVLASRSERKTVDTRRRSRQAGPASLLDKQIGRLRQSAERV